MNRCECYAYITCKTERTEIWREVVPDLRIPLKDPYRRKGIVADEEMIVYLANVHRLKNEQKKKLATLFSEKFNMSRDDVLKELRRTGDFPIKAENVTIKICEMHKEEIFEKALKQTISQLVRGWWHFVVEF